MMEGGVVCLMRAAARKNTATGDARAALSFAAPQRTQQAPGKGFRRCHGSMGADFDAAVAADAAIVVKTQTIFLTLDGADRAVLPALAAQATGIGIGHRPAQKVTPQEGLQAIRAKARGAGLRQLEGDVIRSIAGDARRRMGNTESVGCGQDWQLLRGHTDQIAHGMISDKGAPAADQ